MRTLQIQPRHGVGGLVGLDLRACLLRGSDGRVKIALGGDITFAQLLSAFEIQFGIVRIGFCLREVRFGLVSERLVGRGVD